MSKAQALISPLLSGAGFRHAFFTRNGGVSEGRYASLNLSDRSGDAPPAVAENLRRAAARLGVEPMQLQGCHQVHGRQVAQARPQQSASETATIKADAVWSQAAGLACCVRTADCVPILIADPSSGRVAAVHAGWRGVVADVVGAAVEALVEAGSQAEQLLAAYGPHISARAFEVSAEVAQQLGAVAPAAQAVIETGGRPRVSLAALVSAQLARAGLSPERVDRVTGCTLLDADRFFSYRRSGPGGGHQMSAIVAGP